MSKELSGEAILNTKTWQNRLASNAKLTALPRLPRWWKGGQLPLPKKPIPLSVLRASDCSPSGLRLRPFGPCWSSLPDYVPACIVYHVREFCIIQLFVSSVCRMICIQCRFQTTPSLCQPRSSRRASLSSQQLRSAGFFCGRPCDIKLVTREYERPGHQQRLLQTFTEDVFIFSLLVYIAH